jgi:hypothetical protein
MDLGVPGMNGFLPLNKINATKETGISLNRLQVGSVTLAVVRGMSDNARMCHLDNSEDALQKCLVCTI